MWRLPQSETSLVEEAVLHRHVLLENIDIGSGVLLGLVLGLRFLFRLLRKRLAINAVGLTIIILGLARCGRVLG